MSNLRKGEQSAVKDQIRGCVKINACGKELYGFINDIHQARISCFEQYVRKNTFCAEIYRKDLKRISELAEMHGIKLKSYEYGTLSREVIKRRKRFGAVTGMAVVLAFWLYFSGVVVTIDIQGNDTVSDDEILSSLSNAGIHQGTPFGQIDYVRSENSVLVDIDKLSWVGMHRTGHRLVVEVAEAVPKPEMVRSRIPCNLVSAREAEITDTLVLDGRLMHKVGDYVRPGDLLVTGVTTDDTGHTTLHHAMGTITGIYTDEAAFTEDFTKVRTIRSGAADTRRSLRMFSADIPLSFGRNKYELRECSAIDKPLTFFGKVLPISLRKETYSELVRTETQLSPEDAREVLAEKIYLYEKNFLQDCEILSRDISEEETDTSLTMRVKYRLKGDIGETKEILAK